MNQNQIAKRQPGDDQFIATLRKMEGELAKALPKHMTPTRTMRLVQTAYQKTPKLQKANIKSILGCVMEASSLGLEFNGVGGHAYLVPYDLADKNDKTKKYTICQLMIGFRGMLDLAWRSGNFIDIDAAVVHEKDVFREIRGSEKKLIHEPSMVPNPGKVIGAYAIARLKSEGEVWVYLTVAEINKIKSCSRSGSGADSPWVKWFDEMAKKSAIRRLFKILPCSPEMNQAMAADDEIQAPAASIQLADSYNLPHIENDYDLPPEEELEGDVVDVEENESPKTLADVSDAKERESRENESQQPDNSVADKKVPRKKPAAPNQSAEGNESQENQGDQQSVTKLFDERKQQLQNCKTVAELEKVFGEVMADRTKKNINQAEFGDLDKIFNAKIEEIHAKAEMPPE